MRAACGHTTHAAASVLHSHAVTGPADGASDVAGGGDLSRLQVVGVDGEVLEDLLPVLFACVRDERVAVFGEAA